MCVCLKKNIFKNVVNEAVASLIRLVHWSQELFWVLSAYRGSLRCAGLAQGQFQANRSWPLIAPPEKSAVPFPAVTRGAGGVREQALQVRVSARDLKVALGAEAQGIGQHIAHGHQLYLLFRFRKYIFTFR